MRRSRDGSWLFCHARRHSHWLPLARALRSIPRPCKLRSEMRHPQMKDTCTGAAKCRNLVLRLLLVSGCVGGSLAQTVSNHCGTCSSIWDCPPGLSTTTTITCVDENFFCRPENEFFGQCEPCYQMPICLAFGSTSSRVYQECVKKCPQGDYAGYGCTSGTDCDYEGCRKNDPGVSCMDPLGNGKFCVNYAAMFVCPEPAPCAAGTFGSNGLCSDCPPGKFSDAAGVSL
jgi:hypothetical protein